MKTLIICSFLLLLAWPSVVIGEPIPCRDPIPREPPTQLNATIRYMPAYFDDDLLIFEYALWHKNGVTYTKWAYLGKKWQIVSNEWDVSCGADDAELARWFDEYSRGNDVGMLFNPPLPDDFIAHAREAVSLANRVKIYLPLFAP